MKEEIISIVYEDHDEHGVISQGLIVEGEFSGTLFKVELKK